MAINLKRGALDVLIWPIMMLGFSSEADADVVFG